MVWQRSSRAEPLPSSWREAVGVLKGEALRGHASLHAVCACLDRTPAGAAASDLSSLAQDLAFIGQQLHTLLCQCVVSADTQDTAPAQHGESSPQQQQRQQQQHPSALAEVAQPCVRFCQAVAAAFADLRAPQTPQRASREHSRWHHSQRQQQHLQQQQQQPSQRLPAAAVSALCSCLRQWADPLLLLPGPHPSSTDHPSHDLPLAAVAALGALLPTQLDVITAHEKAAVLALLLALVQPPSQGPSSSAAGAVPDAQQQQQQEARELQDAQHWRLACKAAVVLTDILSEAARSAGTGAAAATAGSGSSKQPSGAAAAAGLRPEEAASITAGLVEALSMACGVRGSGGSSSRGGSMGGAHSSGGGGGGGAVHTNSGSGGRVTMGTAAVGAGSSSSRQQPIEGVQESHYYAALLVALNHAVNSNKQGWQTHAGTITESARKLFTYGARQHQQPKQQQGKDASRPSDPAAAAAPATLPLQQPAAAPAVQQNPEPPARKKYVPPHARGAAAAAAASPQSASSLAQPQQQQQLQDSSDESEQSASDWSDWSDSEVLQGGNSSSRRASGSSSTTSGRERQQQQQLHDPIKAVRVRSALLQLLQVCVQADPKALHPYWAALLPSQAPLQPAPLSPHLVTLLLYDPSDKVRVLAAAVLGLLLEGPAARSLLAVAEAKTAQPPIRGFITMSVSLGHMLMSLHTGLLAVVAAWQQQQQEQEQQPPPPQQQQCVMAVPAMLLSAVLRVLCALVPVTPYERLPASLISDVVDRTWQLWQQLQPQLRLQIPTITTTAAAAAAGGSSRTAVPPLMLSAAAGTAAAAAAGGASTGWGSPGATGETRSSSSSSSSGMLVPTVAVLAQAFSTKQPLQGMGRWLQSSSSVGSNSSRGAHLIQHLLRAAASPDCLIRIEALAALRGCCINYPAAVGQLQSLSCSCHAPAATGSTSTSSTSSRHAALTADSISNSTNSSISNSTNSSSSSSMLIPFDPWKHLLAAVDLSVDAAAAAAQPGSARSTPRSSPRASSSTDSPVTAAPAAAGDGSSSTSPEVKAAQHAVRLLGDWLAAEAAAATSGGTVPAAPVPQAPTTGSAATGAVTAVALSAESLLAAASAGAGAVAAAGVAVSTEEPASVLARQWCSVLTLMLSDTTWRHPSAVIRSASAAVCGAVPAVVWLQLPVVLRQQLMHAAAETAAGTDVTAVRAAACKLLGGCAVLPGVLLGLNKHQQTQQQQQQEGDPIRSDLQTLPQQQQEVSQMCEQQQQQLLLLLQALARCVSDEAVSVRLSASWALANVCDELRRLLLTDNAAVGADTPPQQQQHLCTQGFLPHIAAGAGAGTAAAAGGGGGRPVLAAAVLRLLCDAAVAAAGDTEKVRAHGVRAVGALLAAWQPSWGLSTPTCSTSSSTDATSSSATSSAAVAGSRAKNTAAEGTAAESAATGGVAATGTAAGGTAAPEESWDWVPSWVRSAFGALQSCLAARSMKVVWNAACAAAAALQNQQLLQVAWVAEGAAPSLLRLLVVLVRDSSNFKIKTHAAAALAAPVDRAAYGEVYSDVLLVVLAALQALQGSSSSSAQAAEASAGAGAAAATSLEGQEGGGGDRVDEEGLFPNYRYIPGLQVQLESSLVHLLALLLPSDSSRLQDQLRRNQPLLLSVLSKAAASAGQPAQQQHVLQDAGAGAAGAQHSASNRMLPAQRDAGGREGPIPASMQLGADDISAAASCTQQGFGRECEATGLSGAGSGSADSSQVRVHQQGVLSGFHVVQPVLPADPFGQGSRLTSEDGSAGSRPLPDSRVTSKSSGNQTGSADAKAGSIQAEGVAGGGATCASNGAALGSAAAVAAAGSGSEGRVQAVLGSLSRVLGPSVLDSWARLHTQPQGSSNTGQGWSR